ncbi:NADH-ubiquinone oxidoreductase-F iron-sulfur binding region domain-containing protein [Janthinobacterium sp. 17J80-10]|uniref:complex I 51 kDa subunit family protein n=1 Tax=Janthinobacterium sp. 17J80-10 TaxID=2497863 RepID=UPI001F511BEF|nr:NADH-ubiquinone oxidoreductase-F iron-sulfur binding region domain-containing protein [Janthinobacterium sp. 17J80-10]
MAHSATLPHGPNRSYYHLNQVPLTGHACQGLACFAARKEDSQRWAQAHARMPAIYCLGRCYQAPAAFGDNARPHVEALARETVLLGNLRNGGVHSLASYLANGGGAALRQALDMPPAALIASIAESGLRGRGGAGFPTGRKWAAVAAASGPRKYVVANADEGDPGTFSDRMLMEDDPFLLIEAMLIAALAVGAEHGYIYLRKEYPGAQASLASALQQAHEAGWLGPQVLDSPHRFEIEMIIGQGSYVCGEETAMLNAIEGKRPEVRLRPPQIAEYGLFNLPTLVNNVETLCAVPWIVTHGAQAYARLGTLASRGTKLVSLNSLFRRPGLVEVEFGMPLRHIVDEAGGGLKRGRLLGLMVGGPLAGLVPPALLDTPFCHEELQRIGCAVGHGGMIAFADDTTIPEIMAEVFRFGALESCGKCTPCHLGSPELARMWQAAVAGERISRPRWDALIDALLATSLCGHGRGLAEFARAIERHYPLELEKCFA